VVIFDPPLLPGTLIRRYKRFLADVVLDSGETILAHTPNTGSMLGVSDPGSRIWLSHHSDPKRKTHYTWELTEVNQICVGVNTARSNALAQEAIQAGAIQTLQSYATIRTEVRYGQERSRIDLLLESDSLPPCYVEVKNVTAVDDAGRALFPDARTSRGQKHMRELMHMVACGHRAAIVLTVQRTDCTAFRPAWEIDPTYSELLYQAAQAGVEIYPLQFKATPEAITFQRILLLQWCLP